jgi:uncharacterized protein YjbI with pentapeptide repeats
MRALTQDQLNQLLQLHQDLWNNLPTGRRLELDNYNLQGLDFSGKEMRSCRMVNCNLQNCNFTDCNLSHSELMDSDLRGATLNIIADNGTDYTGCIKE